MKNTVIIVAGGRGKRMGNDIPKQFLLLNGMPVLMRTVERFYCFDSGIKIIIALPADQIPTWENLCRQHRFDIAHHIVEGGHERFHSVKNALTLVDANELVAVHDGVRPLVSTETISRCFEKARQTGAAIPVLDMTESLRYFETPNSHRAVDRNRYKAVQTPQIFRSDILVSAYTQPYNPQFTDDASVVEQYGHPIATVEGNRENIKITTAFDMNIIRMLTDDKQMRQN
ncbi:MAG: 2-C-methyl-D-erythritol 4-phosphate cytidylyltransferase [Prevotellaceae bacterium]|jgi:2-C-methyl-D-erythritol 4-phosphate cytidylyltransferase|nr:2-C-methyl-D-erythritol 4-phosphate cytidylyltransferase [Prevotellaceae bacterium]